jgi:prevent-host-death family protein
MTEIASFEAKSHFSELLRRVTREGEKFVVTVRGKPVAVLGPIQGAMATADSLSVLLNELREFRAKISARGPILKPGETWNEFAREGLD